MIRLVVMLGLVWSCLGWAPMLGETREQLCMNCCPLCTPGVCPCEVSSPEAPPPIEDRQILPERSIDLISQARAPESVALALPDRPNRGSSTEPERARRSRSPRSDLLCVWTT